MMIKYLLYDKIYNNVGLLTDILWSDPDNNAIEWGPNERGVSVTFSESVIESFLQDKDLDLICRAHQVRQNNLNLGG